MSAAQTASEEENHSLDYIEDPYFNPNESNTTPSFDQLDHVEYLNDYDILENELELFNLKQFEFDELNANSLNFSSLDESVNVEAEFFNTKRANAIIRAFFKKDFKRQVRVTYCDLTKPYLAKLPKDSNFRKYLDINLTESGEFPFSTKRKRNNLPKIKLHLFVDDLANSASENKPTDLSHLSLEEQEKQQQAWRDELAQIEDEIATLRTVLAAKMRRSAELKRHLGITVWKEVSDDINQGIKNVKESNV